MSAHLIHEQTAQEIKPASEPRQVGPSEATRPSFCRQSTGALLRASFFSHAKSNIPRRWEGSWDELRAVLAKVYPPQPGVPGGDAKRSMPAISPAFYAPGATRGRESAQGVGLLILDLDNVREMATGEFYSDPRTGEPNGRPKTRKVRIEDPVTMAEVKSALAAGRVASMGWSTWSCSAEWEKFRVVVPLAAPLAFLPGSPDPGSIRRFETAGAPLWIPVEGIPPAPLPTLAPWQAAVVADRQAQRADGERWWMAYRVDGRPVDFHSLDLVAILEARGIKVGPPRAFKNGTKRRACCPWAGEHTGGVDDDAAVLIHTPGTWPSFRCMHSGHSHMGLRDLIEWAWGRP
jgi:hypothetical protein